jgi:DNA-sulfur modification-associated
METEGAGAVGLELPEMPQVSGYDTADRFLASRYRQGERIVYTIDLSLTQVAAYIPAPDPDRPTEGNRKIRVAHAEGFGNYIREKKNWVAPALLLRAPTGLLHFEKFDLGRDIGGIEWGTLSIPRLARTDLHIVDGQHRILGIHRALESIAKELDEARGHLRRAEAAGEPSVVQSARVKVRKLEEERRRLDTERISIQVVLIEDPVEYRQVFVDIADNALGITSAVKVRFDSRKVVNRSLAEVLEHPMLRGHVDMDHDRILGSNPNLLGARHVADIIRTLEVGLSGRITRRREDELTEHELSSQANQFFDTLIGSFTDLAAVTEGGLTVPELRNRSLLGSNVMLRVLAGVYHTLVKGLGRTPGEVAAFFSTLNDRMSEIPVKADSPWTATGVFTEGATAPTARRQDVEMLTQAIVGWASQPPASLASVS